MLQNNFKVKIVPMIMTLIYFIIVLSFTYHFKVHEYYE